MSLTSSITELDFSTQIKDISNTALVVFGDKNSANKKATTDLADNIDGAAFQLIEDASHKVTVDNPEKLASLLETFYRRLF